jgi:hypothetical protein
VSKDESLLPKKKERTFDVEKGPELSYAHGPFLIIEGTGM